MTRPPPQQYPVSAGCWGSAPTPAASRARQASPPESASTGSYAVNAVTLSTPPFSFFASPGADINDSGDIDFPAAILPAAGQGPGPAPDDPAPVHRPRPRAARAAEQVPEPGRGLPCSADRAAADAAIPGRRPPRSARPPHPPRGACGICRRRPRGGAVQLVLHIDDGHEDQTRNHGDDGPCQVTHVRLLRWRNVRRPNCPGKRGLTIAAHAGHRGA